MSASGSAPAAATNRSGVTEARGAVSVNFAAGKLRPLVPV
jgi:hypothetical protein